MKKLAALVVAILVISGAFVAAHSASAEILSGAAGTAQSSVATNSVEPGTVVQAYYQALNSRTLSLAFPLLSDTVVLKVSQPYGDGSLEYKGIQAVQNYLQADMQRMNSLTLEKMTVNGERVEYSVIEWLNPRSVGPAGPFPAINRYFAIVRDGKIQSIVQHPLD